MADKKPTYARGKNPNSLANLKRGKDCNFCDKEKARAAVAKSNEVQRTKRTMRELAESIGGEEQTFQVKRADGTLETVTMTRLEMIMRNFLKECVSNPNHKNVLALAKLRGEDEQHISIDANVDAKYAAIEITQEMKEKAVALLMAKHNNDNGIDN